MFIPTKTTIRMLTFAVTSVTIGLLLPSHAQADRWWTQGARSGCSGDPIQIAPGIDPERATVGMACKDDISVIGSILDGRKATVVPIGQATGDPERDTYGLLPTE